MLLGAAGYATMMGVLHMIHGPGAVVAPATVLTSFPVAGPRDSQHAGRWVPKCGGLVILNTLPVRFVKNTWCSSPPFSSLKPAINSSSLAPESSLPVSAAQCKRDSDSARNHSSESDDGLVMRSNCVALSRSSPSVHAASLLSSEL